MSLLQLVREHRKVRSVAALDYDDDEAERLESSLIDFVEAAWSSIDPSPYQSSWAIDGLCEHLQAVSEGKIRNWHDHHAYER